MKLRALPIALLLAAVPACADQTQAGLQGAFVFPQNDLRTNADGAVGLTFGVHVSLDLQGGSELRPRLDYVQCDTKALHAITFSTTTFSAHGVGLGADYLRFFEERNRGLYGVIGAGVQWWSASDAAHGPTTETAPYVKAGAGFRFDSAVSAEITLDLGKFRTTAGTAGSVQLGLNYRF